MCMISFIESWLLFKNKPFGLMDTFLCLSCSNTRPCFGLSASWNELFDGFFDDIAITC